MKLRGPGSKQLRARLCSMLGLHRLVHDAGAIRIVVYHRIMDGMLASGFPFDYELVDATVDGFDRELRFLASNYDVISFADVINALDNGGALPARPLLITLDDGFRDNYVHALPLLKKYALPATLCLAAAYIGGRETFWYDRLACIVLNLDGNRLEFDRGDRVIDLPVERAGRARVFRQLMKEFGALGNDRRLSVLAEINDRYGTVYEDLPDEVRALSLPLSWEEVNEMVAAGVAPASHTLTHPFLSRLSAGEVERELAGSKALIEARTGTRVDVVAYPNGQPQDFSEQVKMAARDAGYALGLSYIDGVNPPGEFDRYAMKRQHVWPRHDLSVLRMALAWPDWF